MATGTAAKNIDFSGNWSWMNSDRQLNTTQVTLQQNGSVLTGKYNSECGITTIAGVVNKNKIGIQLVIKTNQNDCPSWIQLIASCDNEDCSTIHGTWYNSNSLVGDLVWIKTSKDFYISFPEQNYKFIIDAKPTMPAMKFTVASTDPSTPLEWSLTTKFHWRRGGTAASLPIIITNTNEYVPDLHSWGITGGNLTTKVTYSPSQKYSKTAVGNYEIYGTNPGKALIEKEVTDPLQLKIACVESVYRQFEAEQESGNGLPLIGRNQQMEKVGGVGIMQVRHKYIIPETVWNWRENIKDGLKILNEKRYYAKRFHLNERIRLNVERKKLGLPSCPQGIPSPLTPDQITREILRRYNYGVEYRWEPRDGKNCAGKWVISPTCIRHPQYGCDKDYVDKVLRCSI